MLRVMVRYSNHEALEEKAHRPEEDRGEDSRTETRFPRRIGLIE